MPDAFAKVGVKYEPSERTRSQGYLDALPLFTAGRVRLIDNGAWWRSSRRWSGAPRRLAATWSIMAPAAVTIAATLRRWRCRAGQRLSQRHVMGSRRRSAAAAMYANLPYFADLQGMFR